MKPWKMRATLRPFSFKKGRHAHSLRCSRLAYQLQGDRTPKTEIPLNNKVGEIVADSRDFMRNSGDSTGIESNADVLCKSMYLGQVDN